MNYKLLQKYPLRIFIIIILIIECVSCGDRASLSDNTALSAVQAYLKTNPIFETTIFNIGKVKFNSKNQKELNAYKKLAAEGYIEMRLEKEKKKFLSKDSVYTYTVTLTDKTGPYVQKQKKEKVEIRTFEFQLDEKEKAKIELTSKNSGKVIVTLKKVETDFAVLNKDKNPNSPFITKTFKLKYKENEGWVVTKEK